MTDALSALRVTGPDSIAGQSDAAAFALAASYPDSVAAQSEALNAGVSGYAEFAGAQSESASANVYSFGSSQTTSGTAPTNPSNAIGQNNGTLANCKAQGIPTPTASVLNVTIARGGVPAGGTKTVLAWYRTNAGVADTFTLGYSAPGGTPTSITLPPGDFLTTPFSQAITGIGGADDPVFSFSHNAVVAATGGSVDVDAVAIRSEGVF